LSFPCQSRTYNSFLTIGHFLVMIYSIHAINLRAIFTRSNSVLARLAERHLTVWYFAC
jgi:hypothetical protein